MNAVNYTYIPVLIVLFLQIIFPYMHNFICIDLWIAPHHLFCTIMFLLSYVLFGVSLWKADKINNDKIYAFSWVLIVTNFVWIYYFRKNKEITLIFLFLSLLFGYFTYNSLFLSSLSNDEESLYIDLYSVYMIWIGFMITILIETSPRFIKPVKKRKRNKGRKLI